MTKKSFKSVEFFISVVDWAVGAGTINYISARNQVPPVGALVAEFLDVLLSNGFLTDLSRLSVVGHGLGGNKTYDGDRSTEIHVVKL